jgi:phosphoenolpyruvate synthase/pyruvate phosphate dikinase
MKANNKQLELIIEEMINVAHDSNEVVNVGYRADELDTWRRILSDLETVHYLCMDARRIVNRRIKSAQHRMQRTQKARR